MVATKKTNTTWWPQNRRYAAITSVVALVAAYIMASRAIDTGSLGQYGLGLLLLILAINRLLLVNHPAK